MAKTSQFKLDLKARPSRNVFDRSYRINATAPLGMLRPFFVKDVIAGTKMQLGFENVTRMTNLQAPSFARLREHMDYFFIPYTQLWRSYEQFRTQQSHFNSIAISYNNSNKIPGVVPTCELLQLLSGVAPENIESNDSIYDDCGYYSYENRFLLMHYLGYGGFVFNNADMGNLFADMSLDGMYSTLEPWTNKFPILKKQVNLFRLLAFQKCYYDYYRNEKYESNVIGAYNIDDVVIDGVSVSWPDLYLTTSLCTRPHYRWRKKDYFMSVTPELIPTGNFIGFEGFMYMNINLYSAGGAATPSTYQNTYAYPSRTNYDPNGSNVVPANLGSTVLPTNDNNPSNDVTAKQVDVNSLKLMFAREKLLKRMYMAKNNYSSQMLALFGFAPSTMRTDSVYHIGGCCNRIVVDDMPIYANGVERSSIGTFAGKVAQYSQNKKCAEFEAKEDGIVLGIYSTSIENDYAANGIERDIFRYTMEDFPFQEYQDLGRQVLLRSEFGNWQIPVNAQTPNKEGVIGFVERYLEYKTSYDKVFYPYIDNSCKDMKIDSVAVSSGSAVADFARFATPTNTFKHGLSANSYPRIQNPQNLYIQTMLVAPWQMDNMVGVDYDGSAATDCFMINGYNHFKAITPLKEKEF